jgi:hypothetical protein
LAPSNKHASNVALHVKNFFTEDQKENQSVL